MFCACYTNTTSADCTHSFVQKPTKKRKRKKEKHKKNNHVLPCHNF